MPIRLAIVDDYEVVVRGLAHMLEPYADLEVVELDSRTDVSRPVDIALCDTFAMPQAKDDGLGEIVDNPLVDRVVVYSWNMDRRLIAGALEHGVSGYLSKMLPADRLVEGLRAVHAGEQVVAGESGDHVEQGDWPGREHGLTMREAEVIALVTQGLSNAEIAQRVGVSINSVKTYIRTGYRKIGVTSRTNAVLWGVEHGFAPDRVRTGPAAPTR